MNISKLKKNDLLELLKFIEYYKFKILHYSTVGGCNNAFICSEMRIFWRISTKNPGQTEGIPLASEVHLPSEYVLSKILRLFPKNHYIIRTDGVIINQLITSDLSLSERAVEANIIRIKLICDIESIARHRLGSRYVNK